MKRQREKTRSNFMKHKIKSQFRKMMDDKAVVSEAGFKFQIMKYCDTVYKCYSASETNVNM